MLIILDEYKRSFFFGKQTIKKGNKGALTLLEWTSDTWGKLMGPYGSGENVPMLLQQLMQEYNQETADELFQEYLFHQNTIYTVTYAAVPYLAKMARMTKDPEVQRHLFITCGIIEASRDKNDSMPYPTAWAELAEDVGASICEDIYSGYIEAIRDIASLSEEVVTHTALAPIDDVEKRYILIADSAFRGSNKVANMLLTFTAGDEYIAVCQECNQEVYLWPNEEDGHIQAFAQDPVFEEEQQAQIVIPASQYLDADQAMLADQVMAIGEHGLARHLPYLAGETNCPSCGVNIPIWQALLSIFD